MMAYATLDDLAEYLGVEKEDLPPDADRLLERSSELIDYATIGKAEPNKDRFTDMLRLATCAQVEMWVSEGEDVAIRGPIQSFSLGKWSVTYASSGGSSSNSQPQLAPRARHYLMLAGLLYRGVAMR